MTHTYIVSGMTCAGCAAKVRHKLLLNPDITGAEIDLEGHKAQITMHRHLTVPDLQRTIGADGKYQISEDASDTTASEVSSHSWIVTYKPLLIIAAFISGVSVITAGGNLHAGMTYFMSGFFLVFSFFKLLDLKGFAESYAMYDIVARKVPAYGYVYPFFELALGIAFLVGYNPLLVDWITVGLMGISTIGVIQSVVNKSEIRCACLGAVFNLPMSTVTIVEDVLMIVMAFAMIAGV